MSDNKYIVKPQGISQDKRLTPTEQDYLCLIWQLENAEKGCIASNKYFAEYFGVKRPTAIEVISSLRRKHFIGGREKKHGGKTIERTLFVIDENSRKFLLMDSSKSAMGIVGNLDLDSRKPPKQKIKEENKRKERSALQTTSEIFVKPSPEEVTDYAVSIGFKLDGQYFCDCYEARGWSIGKNPMKDWRAAVRTWKERDNKNCGIKPVVRNANGKTPKEEALERMKREEMAAAAK